MNKDRGKGDKKIYTSGALNNSKKERKNSGGWGKDKWNTFIASIIALAVIVLFVKLDGSCGLITGIFIWLFYLIFLSVHKKINAVNQKENESFELNSQDIQEKQKSMLFKRNRNQDMKNTDEIASDQNTECVPTCKNIQVWYTQVKEESIKLREEHPIWENGRLLDFMQIAGTRHYFPDDELNEKVHENDKLVLIREPENTFDANAIAVLTQNSEHIGYIPQKRNLIISALLDSGTKLFARVFGKCIFEGKLYIAIEIFVSD